MNRREFFRKSAGAAIAPAVVAGVIKEEVVEAKLKVLGDDENFRRLFNGTWSTNTTLFLRNGKDGKLEQVGECVWQSSPSKEA